MDDLIKALGCDGISSACPHWMKWWTLSWPTCSALGMDVGASEDGAFWLAFQVVERAGNLAG